MAITIYEEAKLWFFIVGSLWTVYRVVSWILEIRTEDFKKVHANLAEIKDSVHSQTTTLRVDLERQTNAIVGELKELRADLRGLNSARPQLRLAKATGAPKRPTKKK